MFYSIWITIPQTFLKTSKFNLSRKLLFTFCSQSGFIKQFQLRYLFSFISFHFILFYNVVLISFRHSLRSLIQFWENALLEGRGWLFECQLFDICWSVVQISFIWHLLIDCSNIIYSTSIDWLFKCKLFDIYWSIVY